MRNQTSAPLPSHAPRRSAMSAEIAARPLTTRESVTRETPSAVAASTMLRPNSGNTSCLRISPGWGGLCIFMCVPSVIVLVVHKHRIGAVECERQAPVRIDSNRPMSGGIALQWVQMPTWDVQCLRIDGFVQCRQLATESVGMRCLDSGCLAGEKKPLDSLVPKRFDHACSVSLCDTKRKCPEFNRCKLNSPARTSRRARCARSCFRPLQNDAWPDGAYVHESCGARRALA